VLARLEADGGRARIEWLRDWLLLANGANRFPYDADGRTRTSATGRVRHPNYAGAVRSGRRRQEPNPPLNKATDWVHVELDLGDGLQTYTRDTNVMPQWAGSSWYELRYADPYNSETFCAKENEAY
jgi:leucyl-tRNA synthetase